MSDYKILNEQLNKTKPITNIDITKCKRIPRKLKKKLKKMNQWSLERTMPMVTNMYSDNILTYLVKPIV